MEREYFISMKWSRSVLHDRLVFSVQTAEENEFNSLTSNSSIVRESYCGIVCHSWAVEQQLRQVL